MTAPSLEIAKQLHEAGRLAEAEAAYRAFLEHQPAHAGALFRLATLAAQTGRGQLAVDLLRRVVQNAPDFADAHNDLSTNLRDLGRFDEAVTAAREAIRIEPDHVKAHVNLGNALIDLHRFEEGINCYREALRIQPDMAEGHGNLGLALVTVGQLDEALISLRESIRLKPDYAEGQNGLGNVLLGLGDAENAIAAYRRSMEAKPDYADGHSNMLFALNYVPGTEANEVAAEHRAWWDRHGQPLIRESMPFINDRSPHRRMRIGFVSPDFRRHSVCYFFIPLLEYRDREMFKVYCYSSARKGDDLTEWVKRSCDEWRNAFGMTDDELARVIRFDEIDILVDLSGHTANNRLPVFARKPAPIQVTYLGYPNTTGMSAMDYRLTDALADPPATTDPLHVERLWRLPRCAWCFRPLEGSPEVKPRNEGTITFGCFNALSKVNRQLVAIWAELLGRVPNSRLLLKATGAAQRSAQQRIIRQFQERGVSGDRIEMLGHIPGTTAHLKTYDRVDVALDTFPYDGTTTTCEALWMGVPVVTLAGEVHASRVGVSLLTNVGLTELIAQNAQQYVSIAAELAANPARLASLRTELRKRMASSPLMDGRRYTREVEAAFRQMWETFSGFKIPSGAGPKAAQEGKLHAAVGDHQAGRLLEAERRYREILAADPENADALQLLGAMAGQLGYADGAISLIRRAVELAPNNRDAQRNLAVLLAKQSRFEEAIAVYRRVLAFSTDDAEVQNDLGKVYLAAGRTEDAIKAHQLAIGLQPNFADAHRALGDDLRKAGRYEESVEAYSKALGLASNWPEARYGLGEALLGVGRSQDAMKEFALAIRLKPDFANALVGLGNAFQKQSRIADAAEAYSAAIRVDPGHALAHFNLGQAFKCTDRLDDARRQYEEALRVKPDYLQAIGSMITVLATQQRLDEAMEWQRKAMTIDPNSPVGHMGLGEILLRTGNTDVAIASFQRAAAIDPENHELWNALGAALLASGNVDRARECFGRALEISPGDLSGMRNLASIAQGAEASAEIARLRTQLQRGGMEAENEIFGRFALGKLLDDADLFEEAFQNYSIGNRLVKERRASVGEIYDADAFSRQVDQWMRWFTREFFEERRGWGEATELPVFVVGMPRSGTTLVHQILASHSGVHGAGELTDIGEVEQKLMSMAKTDDPHRWTAEEINSAARGQLEKFSKRGGSASRLVDKMPGNLLRLGLIALLFPRSRVVICLRDPRDTALSCFFQNFSTGNEFSFDLMHCLRHQIDSDRFADHWLGVRPIQILELRYEKLVADPEGQSRRLMEFVGLPWEPACLEFYRAKSAVLTSSAWQVRQPIYNRSVSRWRHYERHIGPLWDSLRSLRRS